MSNQRKFLYATLISLAVINSQTANATSSTPWQFEIAPYLWALNMDGRVQTGPIKTHVDESFSDILKHFNGGGMLWASANKDKLGLFVNALYAVLSDSVTDGPITITAQEKFALYTAGASYEVYKHNFASASETNPGYVSVEPYIGARYTMNDVTLRIPRFSLGVANNQHWVDPILGVRLNYIFNYHWRAMLAGDIGGTNANKHSSYNFNGVLGYTPTFSKNVSFYLGYRYLFQHYVTGNGLTRFDWDMRLSGPMLGVGFRF